MGIGQIQIVSIPVSDQETAKQFYVEALGFDEIRVQTSKRRTSESWARTSGCTGSDMGGGIGSGPGYPVPQQLTAAGERVVDVPAPMGVAGSLVGVGRIPKDRPE